MPLRRSASHLCIGEVWVEADLRNVCTHEEKAPFWNTAAEVPNCIVSLRLLRICAVPLQVVGVNPDVRDYGRVK